MMILMMRASDDITHQLNTEHKNVEFILHDLSKRYVQAMSRLMTPVFAKERPTCWMSLTARCDICGQAS